MLFVEIIVEAISVLYEHRLALGRALIIPFALYLGLDVTDLYEFTTALFYPLALALHVIIAVTTHRIILLGDDSINKYWTLVVTKRELMFFLHLIGLFLIIGALFAFFLIPIIGWAISLLLISWVSGRLSLVFPAIAIDKDVSFRYSWDATRDYQVIMFAVVAIFPVILSIPVGIVKFIPQAFWLSSVLGTVVTIFEVAALSVTYRYIKEEVEMERF